MVKKKKVLFYRIRTYDGRYNPGDKFTSFKAALNEAKRLFGWKRIYTAMCGNEVNWYSVEDNIDGIEIADKPTELHKFETDCPVIEKHYKYV